MTATRSAGARQPTREQAAAIDRRDRSVFLEAGAGTGKTSVLVGRYCDAVTDDGVATDSILAFTFTERAAGELRTRIRGELLVRARSAHELGDEARASELSALARDSERAWISTIHSFCRRLLTATPFAAGIDPRFRVLDEPESSRVAKRAFDAALEELALERDAAALLAAGFQPQRLFELIRGAYEAFRGQAVAHPELPEVLAVPTGDDPDAAPTEVEAAEVTEAYAALRDLFQAFGRSYTAAKSERSGLDFEDLQLRALELLRRSSSIRDRWRERFAHILVDEFQDTNRLQVELISELQGPDTKVFVVGDELQSIYSFRHADLEVFRAERLRAERAAEGDTELLRLGGSFRSSPAVLAAVNAIGSALIPEYRELTVGRDDHPAPAGHGAAVELLLTAQDGWDAEGCAIETATDSGASHVAEARRLATRMAALAAAGVPRGEMVVLLRAFTHVRAFEEAFVLAGLRPQVIGGRGYWSHQQVEDAICLLSAIANPLDDEPLLGALSSPACGASADALWLLRALAGERRHIWPALALEFGDEPAGEDEPGPASDAPPVQGSLLELFEDDEDRIDEERRRKLGAVFGGDDRARLETFHRRLTELRQAAPILPLDELCETAISAFEYDLTTLARTGGRGRMANLRKLVRLARDFETREGRDLRGFLDYVTTRGAAADAEGQAATQAEGVDGVRIMTVHAAKGLEFPVVAVADLGRDLLAGGRRPDLRVGRVGLDEPPRVGLRLVWPGRESVTLGDLRELGEEEAASAAEEALRLAHVAFTRAEERLFLSGTIAESALEPAEVLPDRASVIARLVAPLGVSGDDGQIIPVAAPAARPGLDATFAAGEIAVTVTRPEPEAATELALRDRAGADRVLPGRGDPPLAELRPPSEALPLRPLSYSALASYSRCGYRFYVERVLGLRPLDSGGGASVAETGSVRAHRLGFGNAIHALLEWSARNRWASPSDERMGSALADQGLTADGDGMTKSRTMVERWLDSELLASLRRPLARVHPEMSFLLELSGTVIRGQIDLLVETPGEPPVVVDYKTDALAGRSAAERMTGYATQRDLYAVAVGSGAADRGVRTAYTFLDSGEPAIERSFDRSSLDDARARLERLVAGIGAGSFEVSPSPHRGLCLECPARERLCSHPAELTLAERPAQAA